VSGLDRLGRYAGTPTKRLASSLVGASGTISPHAARTTADALYSAQKARADYDDNPAFVEQFDNLSAWTLAATPGVQVSGGDAFATNPSQGGGSGANKAFALAAGENARAVFIVNQVNGGASGGLIVGVSSNAAGATPTAAGGSAFGLYFHAFDTVVQQCSNGVFSNIAGSPAGVSGQYVVTVTVDQQWISVVARLVGGTSEIRCRRPRAGFSVNNLYMFISDARNTAGNAVRAVGARKQFGSIAPRALIEGVGQTVHWTGDGASSFKLTLPESYDSRVSLPVAIMFHGNGSDENHFSDNANGILASNALLGAGFGLITCTAASTTTWGAPVSIDAYVAAYRFFRDRYAIGPIVLYANSMGSLEALLAIKDGRLNGVLGLAMTHPAVSLASAYEDRFGIGFNAAIRSAYGIAADGSDYASKTEGRDPVLLDVADFRGVPMWMLYASDDASVNQAESAVALRAKLQAASSAITVQTTTGGHSASIAPFTAAIVSFLNACIGR
jgi:pimeloyl-ACP methyl ester carboxylesterase